MSLSDRKITDAQISTNGMVSAQDRLTGTAQQNKMRFDQLIRESVKTDLNGLIDDLEDAGAAALLGAEDAEGNDSTIQDELDNCVKTADYNPVNKTEAMTQQVGKDSDGALWTEPGGGGGGIQLFTLSGTSDLVNAQLALDWARDGNIAIVKIYDASANRYRVFISGTDVGVQLNFNYIDGVTSSYDSSGKTTVVFPKVLSFLHSAAGVVSSISMTDNLTTIRYLDTQTDYTAIGTYTPENNGAPATKKYVDDELIARVTHKIDPVSSGSDADLITPVGVNNAGKLFAQAPVFIGSYTPNNPGASTPLSSFVYARKKNKRMVCCVGENLTDGDMLFAELNRQTVSGGEIISMTFCANYLDNNEPYTAYYTVTASGWTKTVQRRDIPSGGIPASDLSSAVQTSLGKADSALQEHQSLAAYRTAAAQDEIDAGKGTYSKPSGGIPASDLSSAVQTSLGKADSALQEHQDISGKENTSNKVKSISAQSTDTQYPSAKCLYDRIGGNIRIFTLSSLYDYATATAIYDWYASGKTPMLANGRNVYLVHGDPTTSYMLLKSIDEIELEGDVAGTSDLRCNWIKFIVSDGNVTNIMSYQERGSSFINPRFSYRTPYTPLLGHNPATKKYVDDALQFDGTFVVDGDSYEENESTHEITAGLTYTGKTAEQIEAILTGGSVPKMSQLVSSQALGFDTVTSGFTKRTKNGIAYYAAESYQIIRVEDIGVVPAIADDGKFYNLCSIL